MAITGQGRKIYFDKRWRLISGQIVVRLTVNALILIGLFCTGSPAGLLAQTVVRGPYLQTATDTSMIVRWRTSSATDSRVWYGPGPTLLNDSISIAGSMTDHELQIAGLDDSTRYYYAIGNAAGVMAGGDSAHFFLTAPVAGTPAPMRFWVLGDCGTANSNQAAVRDAYYDFTGDTYTNGILLLGDNAYDTGTDAEYQGAIFAMYDSLLKQSALWATPGNHDYGSGADATTQTGPYYDIFSLPKFGEAGGLPSGTEAYYSFDVGNVHFISLDSHDSDRSPGGDMLTWLENDLLSTLQDWIIVIWHHPPYTKGSHDSDSDSDSGGRMVQMRENVLPLLEDHGVDLVLTGHSHSYERSMLIQGHYGYSSTFVPATMALDDGDGQIDGDGAYVKSAETGEGAVYIVAGSSGKTSSGLLNHPVMYYSAMTLGSVVLDVTGDALDVKFINNNGDVDDYLTINRVYYAGIPPDITLVSPVNGTFYEAPVAVDLTAEASDPDGEVEFVEFFVNELSVGVDSAAPYAMTWNIPSDGIYTIRASVVDDSMNVVKSGNHKIMVGTISISSRVLAGSDDAEESAAGSVGLTSSDLELTTETSVQTVGIRFRDVYLPDDARILNAYLQFTVDETNNLNPCSLVIHGEDTSFASTFTTASMNITHRTTTTTSVAWDPPLWNAVNDAGPAQQSPDLSDIVQEIINRYDYDPGNSLAFIITGTGRRNAESFNGESLSAPELFIEYDKCPAAGTPCDDGDPLTINDEEDGFCHCIGQVTSGSTDFLITAGSDDVEENGNDGSLYVTSSDIELVNDGSRGDQIIGLRYQNVDIPQGSFVNKAYLQFTTDEADAGVNAVNIKAELAWDSAPFTGGVNSVSSRPTTAGSRNWTIPEWLVVPASGNDQRTPELRHILQEVVDQPGWEQGNALSVIIAGTGSKTAESYEGSPAQAARLHVEWDTVCTLSHIAYVDPDAHGKETGDSWQDAYSSLEDALFMASSCPGIGEVWVKGGTYLPDAAPGREATFLMSGDFTIYGGFDGTEVSLGSRDPVANPTILSGDIGVALDASDNTYHVATVAYGDTVTLDGITLLGGAADGAMVDQQSGAGICVSSGTLVLKDVEIVECQATTSGNAVLVDTANAILQDVLIDIANNGVTHIHGRAGAVIEVYGVTDVQR